MFWKRFFNVLLVLFLSTLTACLLYPLIQRVSAAWIGLDYPPSRVFRRIWMLSVVAGLIVAGKKWLGMRSPGSVGFSLTKNSLPNLGIGLLAVFVFWLFLSGLYATIGAWLPSDPLTAAKWPKKVIQGFIQGTLVGGLEEYVFRGMIFLSLCRSWGWARSAVFTSLIFSSLHFLEGRGAEAIANASSWHAGFRICGLLFANMAHSFNLFPDAVGLFIVGMALCHAAWRTGALWYGAGLHGGWIWFSAFRSSLFSPSGSWSDLWIGGVRLFDGVFPIFGILLIFPITEWLVRKQILSQPSTQPE